MMIALSDSNCDKYWQPQYESIVIYFGKKEEIWRQKGSLGQSLEQYIPLRHGLSLEISDDQMY